jgi:hypothetical protein
VLRSVASTALSLMVAATFLWGGCVSCEQFFMFPGKKQPCCNKSGQCERPGKTSPQPEKQDCKRLPFDRAGSPQPIPVPAILPEPVLPEIAPASLYASLRVESFELLLDPSPPDLQSLHATFLI